MCFITSHVLAIIISPIVFRVDTGRSRVSCSLIAMLDSVLLFFLHLRIFYARLRIVFCSIFFFFFYSFALVLFISIKPVQAPSGYAHRIFEVWKVKSDFFLFSWSLTFLRLRARNILQNAEIRPRENVRYATQRSAAQNCWLISETTRVTVNQFSLVFFFSPFYQYLIIN